MTVSEGRVIVTGATRGIGRATVDALLSRGGSVIGIARDVDALGALEASHPDRFRGVAAHLENKGCTVLDMTGLAQKFGAVTA